ncbi:MAG: hypothetical protein HKN30_05930 [Sulfitobacter sp.]|nr:hypothetical protein [Sulfitobacter sp.]
MAISTTSFEERVTRIEARHEERFGQPKRRRGSRITFPFFAGIGIVMGGTAYAFAATTNEIQWILAIAQ